MKTTDQRLPMKTFTDENAAHTVASSRNGSRVDYVVVDGPEEGQYTVMHILDAIDGCFSYSWRAR